MGLIIDVPIFTINKEDLEYEDMVGQKPGATDDSDLGLVPCEK